MRSSAAQDAMISPPRTKGRGSFGDSCLLAASPFAWLTSPGACEDGKDEGGFHAARDSVAWLASPSVGLEVLSPLESTMSCSLSSPPHHLTSPQAVSSPHSGLQDLLSSTFSPSIFSPEPTVKPQPAERRKLPMAAINSFSLFDSTDISPMLPDSRLLADSAGASKNGEGRSTRRNHDSSASNGTSNRSSWLEGYEERPKKQRTLIITPDHPRSPPGDAKRSRSSGSERATALVTPATENVNASGRGMADVNGNRAASSTGGKDFNLRKSAAKMESILSVVKATMGMASEENANKPKVACKCKKSRCLKLYCDCFAILNYCNPIYCKCTQCNNSEDHEEVRSEAIRITKERNSFAFKEKITDQEMHVAGCHCKNSHCLKKYCECFTGAALCSANCKCQGCENYSGSTELARVRNLAIHSGNVTPADHMSSSSGVHASHLLSQSSTSSSGSINGPLYSNSHNRKRKDSPNNAAWVSPPSLTPQGKASIAPPSLSGSATTSATGATAAVAPKSTYSLRGSSRLAMDAQPEAPAPVSLKRYGQRSTTATATTTAAAASTAAKRSPSSAVKKVAFALPSRGHPHERDADGGRDLSPEDEMEEEEDASEEGEDVDNEMDEEEEEDSEDADLSGAEVSRKGQEGSRKNVSVDGEEGTPTDCMDDTMASRLPSPQYMEFQHKKRVEVFPFFGQDLPSIPKASFLQVLEHLSNREIYSSSLVNVLWSRAAFDDALWESNT